MTGIAPTTDDGTERLREVIEAMGAMTAGGPRHRNCDFCQPRGLLDACLLLLLREHPAHGYDLRARLDRLGLKSHEPGAVYRALRRLDQEGLARSRMQPSDCTGPDRRVYAITSDGERMLEQTYQAVADLVDTLHTFLCEYEDQRNSAVPEPTHIRSRDPGAASATRRAG